MRFRVIKAARRAMIRATPDVTEEEFIPEIEATFNADEIHPSSLVNGPLAFKTGRKVTAAFKRDMWDMVIPEDGEIVYNISAKRST